MAYLSWTLAILILRDRVSGALTGSRAVNVPLLASSNVVAWEVEMARSEAQSCALGYGAMEGPTLASRFRISLTGF
jgi:hypothetical protein